jgi:nucleotide-binding universal stress UspA family protein
MTDIRKVLFPVDFSERCAGAAHYVEAFARLFDTSIEMVHVLPPPHYESISLEVSGPALAEVLAGRKEFAETQLASFLGAELKPFPVTRVLLEGDPATEVVRHSRDCHADLIALPTHGYGPFRRFILGSVAAKVLHDSDVPVLTGVHMEQAPPMEKIHFRRIVAAVDLGPGSEKVLCWAGGLARAMGADLVVVHVLPSLEGRTGGRA